jgi:hypothetical protein
MVLRSIGGAPTLAIRQGARVHVPSEPIQLMPLRAFHRLHRGRARLLGSGRVPLTLLARLQVGGTPRVPGSVPVGPSGLFPLADRPGSSVCPAGLDHPLVAG